MNERQLLRLNAVLLGVLVALALGVTLYVARPVILPFVVALFGAFTVEPPLRLLERRRIPRWVGTLVIVALLFVVIQAVVSIFAGAVEQFRERLPEYMSALQDLVDRLPLPQKAQGRVKVDEPDFWQELMPVKAVMSRVGSWARTVTAFLSNAVLVLLLMVALILGRRGFDERVGRAAGSATGQLEESARVIDAIDAGIQRYMLLKTVLSIGVGFIFWFVLWLFDADFAVLWGFITFLFNYVPTVGPTVSTIPAMAMLLLQYSDEPLFGATAAVCTGFVPFLYGNVIEPKVLGDTLNMNFLAVLFALILWGFLWGAVGAVLAVPITMAISMLCREVPALRPIHELLRA